MFPLNGDTIAALFLGLILGMFLMAILLFIYGLVTGHTAYQENERFLSRGIKTLLREEGAYTNPPGRAYHPPEQDEE